MLAWKIIILGLLLCPFLEGYIGLKTDFKGS